MKRILIPVFNGQQIRTLFRSTLFQDLLADPSSAIDILCVPDIQELLSSILQPPTDRVRVLVCQKPTPNRSEQIFNSLKYLLLNTETMAVRRKKDADENGKIFTYHLKSFIAKHLGDKPRIVHWLRRLDARFKEKHFQELFQSTTYSAVFLMHLFSGTDICLLKAARQQGIRTIGFINSWDKLTSRCIIRILPDLLLVPSQAVYDQAISLHIPAAILRITGVPAFDCHARLSPTARTIYLQEQLRLPSEAQYLLHCPVGTGYIKNDQDYIAFLLAWIDEQPATQALFLVVRCPPNDTIELNEAIRTHPRLRIQQPTSNLSRKRGINWDFTEQQQQDLVDALTHASVVTICSGSTMLIDAAIRHRPTIMINFDLNDPGKPMKSVTSFSKLTHVAELTTHNAFEIVTDPTNLSRALKEALSSPHSTRIAEQDHLSTHQGFNPHGEAAKRIAEFLLHQDEPKNEL